MIKNNVQNVVLAAAFALTSAGACSFDDSRLANMPGTDYGADAGETSYDVKPDAPDTGRNDTSLDSTVSDTGVDTLVDTSVDTRLDTAVDTLYDTDAAEVSDAYEVGDVLEVGDVVADTYDVRSDAEVSDAYEVGDVLEVGDVALDTEVSDSYETGDTLADAEVGDTADISDAETDADSELDALVDGETDLVTIPLCSGLDLVPTCLGEGYTVLVPTAWVGYQARELGFTGVTQDPSVLPLSSGLVAGNSCNYPGYFANDCADRPVSGQSTVTLLEDVIEVETAGTPEAVVALELIADGALSGHECTIDGLDSETAIVNCDE